MIVLGIDLSGPGSPESTGVAVCRGTDSKRHVESLRVGALDDDIVELIPIGGEVVVGIDAPLSYGSATAGPLENNSARTSSTWPDTETPRLRG